MNYSELLQLAKGWGNFKFYRGIIWRLRNIIAHQTDRTHEDAQRLEITKEIAAGFIKDVEQIVQAMEEEAETKTA